LLDIVRQAAVAGGGASSETTVPAPAPTLPPLVPVVVKWYDGGQRELLPLGIMQVARITRLNVIARHLLPLLPSRLRARDNPQAKLPLTSNPCLIARCIEPVFPSYIFPGWDSIARSACV
jgi:hypothetical protein